MTEAELEIEVVDLCEQLRLLWHHCTSSTRCRGRRGLPDMVIVGPRGHLFRELKGADGETTSDQDLWGWSLNRSARPGEHIDATISLWSGWWPGDWHNGRIRKELEAIA
jgi:hypothetical protein